MRASMLFLVVFLLAEPGVAQIPGVLHGRVEDAISGAPIEGARIWSTASSPPVFTDSLGAFALPVVRDSARTVFAEQFGYVSERYELGPEASSQITVLVLEPAPIEIEGVTVVEEGAVTTFLNWMERRRDGYAGSVRTFNRDRIEQLGGSSAYDLVQRAIPGARPCGEFGLDLCRRTRGRQGRILVCVDDWLSYDPVAELEGLPIESVAMVELYGPTLGFGLTSTPPGLSSAGPRRQVTSLPMDTSGQIRIYTAGWILGRASRERQLRPLTFGC